MFLYAYGVTFRAAKSRIEPDGALRTPQRNTRRDGWQLAARRRNLLCMRRGRRLRLAGAITFNALDHVDKPVLDSLLQLRLSVLAFHSVDRFPDLVQGDVVTGNGLFLAAARYEV